MPAACHKDDYLVQLKFLGNTDPKGPLDLSACYALISLYVECFLFWPCARI